MDKKFTGNFTQQEAISETAIEAAIAVLQSGRLHRYNLAAGEIGEVAALENDFAAWQGTRYCLAVTSGGQAMQLALRAAGVSAGDKVLTNAFTLAPVPGAIYAIGATPVLVEIDENLRIDFTDLYAKTDASKARYLLISHMRGHLCDMEALSNFCNQFNLTMLEDCAHTMGARWNGKRSGNFGLAGCFSTQTYKHLNSGEGGLLTSNDPDFIARATILSGSYMLYPRHGASPDAIYFNRAKYQMPNCSARLDALRAAILRVQLRHLDTNCHRWNKRYDAITKLLRRYSPPVSPPVSPLVLPQRPTAEAMVGSSLQFRLTNFSARQCELMLQLTATAGVELKWFGRKEPHGFTAAHPSWHFLATQQLPQSDNIMATLFDLRIPLSFSLPDCKQIAEIIIDCHKQIMAQQYR